LFCWFFSVFSDYFYGGFSGNLEVNDSAFTGNVYGFRIVVL